MNKPDKWNKENILNLLKQNNLIIMDKDYQFNNAKQKIKCLNSEGYIVNAYINSLLKGIQPHIFNGNKYATENLKLFCHKNNLILADNQIWKGIKIKYIAYTQEGYKVLLNVDTLLRGYKPAIFKACNSFVTYNIKRFCEINDPDYILISNNYINKSSKLTFKYIGIKEMLEQERYFKVNSERFLYCNQRHPKFNQSKGEILIQNYLLNHKYNFKNEFKFSDCKNIRLLKFDFALFKNKDKKQLLGLIEFDGIQHFEIIDRFGGEEGFNYRQQNDKIKNEYCKKNNIPLLRIPYWDLKNIDNILDINLFNNGADLTLVQELYHAS